MTNDKTVTAFVAMGYEINSAEAAPADAIALQVDADLLRQMVAAKQSLRAGHEPTVSIDASRMRWADMGSAFDTGCGVAEWLTREAPRFEPFVANNPRGRLKFLSGQKDGIHSSVWLTFSHSGGDGVERIFESFGAVTADALFGCVSYADRPALVEMAIEVCRDEPVEIDVLLREAARVGCKETLTALIGAYPERVDIAMGDYCNISIKELGPLPMLSVPAANVAMVRAIERELALSAHVDSDVTAAVLSIPRL